MKQADLNRAVARATGESVSLIDHMGFTLLVTPVVRQPRREVAVHRCSHSSRRRQQATRRHFAHAA
jgi:hypothetical protein